MIFDYPRIDYNNLFAALAFYKSKGFQEISVPWLVKRDVQNLTMHDGTSLTDKFDIIGSTLVGSAEQSFLDLTIKNKLEFNKRYVALTPCFRDETQDDLHFPYFMKVELFCASDQDISRDFSFIAMDLFSFLRVHSKIAETEIGHDLISNGIELGSYGHRKIGEHSWSYGTGLAEPRFSFVKNGLQ